MNDWVTDIELLITVSFLHYWITNHHKCSSLKNMFLLSHSFLWMRCLVMAWQGPWLRDYKPKIKSRYWVRLCSTPEVHLEKSLLPCSCRLLNAEFISLWLWDPGSQLLTRYRLEAVIRYRNYTHFPAMWSSI